VFPLLVGPELSADQQEIGRSVAVQQVMRVTHTLVVKLILALNLLVEQTPCVSEMAESLSMPSSLKPEVTVLSVAVPMATLEILSFAVMPTPALRAPVVQMLIVNRLEIALFVSAGKDMRVTLLLTVS